MVNFIRDIGFDGIDDFFPDEMKIGVVELSRRLDRMLNSMVYQLRKNPTVFSNTDDDEPGGMVVGDVWTHRDGTVQVFDGTNWVP